MRIIRSRARELILIAVIIVISVLATLANPNFLTIGNFSNILNITSTMGIMSVGMTLIIATGNLDVTVGSLFYAACVVAGTLSKAWEGENIMLIVLSAVGVGLAIGAANGSLISHLKMPSIVVTLAMMSIVRGVVLVITDGVMITNLVGPFSRIASTKFGPLYITPMIWLIASFVVFFLVHKVRFGREILALGSNAAAAERIGIDKKRINIIVFMLASALTGLAGAFYTSKIGNIQAQLGVGYEMKVIAAVIIGGTSFKGGKISLLGTFCGVILMGFIDNMLVLMRVPTYWQMMTIGGVLLAAVVSSAFTSDAAGKGIKFDPSNIKAIFGGVKDA